MAAQPRKIVVGFDGTESARRALDAAGDLTGYGSTLTVVSVAREGRRDDGDALEQAHEHLLRKQVFATYLRRTGNPADELVEAARELGADLVVVGRRDGSELDPAAPGSVSASVVLRASCDVLVVS